MSAALINAIARDVPLKLIADKGSLRQGFGYESLVVRKDLFDSGAVKTIPDLKGRKIANVYALAPNYQAGKDMIAGFKRGFSGPMTGEVYTQLTQTDYAAELSQIRAANPAAVFNGPRPA